MGKISVDLGEGARWRVDEAPTCTRFTKGCAASNPGCTGFHQKKARFYEALQSLLQALLSSRSTLHSY